MKEVTVTLAAFIAAVTTLVFVSFLLSWPVMILWNEALIPAIPGLKEIGWVQAWGIEMLFSILFKISVTK